MADPHPQWNHYALADPRIADPVLAVRYIGRTTRTLYKRLSQHLSDAKRGRGWGHKDKWLRKLIRDNVVPTLVDLGVGDGSLEAELIATYKFLGASLTNGTSGGDGAKLSPETRNRLRTRQLEKLKDPEYRHRRREGLAKAQSDTEYRAKVSDQMKKQWRDPEWRARVIPRIKETYVPHTYTPEELAKRSKQALDYYSHQENRERARQEMLRLRSDPEVDAKFRRAQIEAAKERAAKRTHCPHGHPYSGDNLFVRPSGARGCRTCAREQGALSAKRVRLRKRLQLMELTQ